MARRRYRYDPSEHSAAVPGPVEQPAPDPTKIANERLQKSNRRLGTENAKLRRDVAELSYRLEQEKAAHLRARITLLRRVRRDTKNLLPHPPAP